MSSSNTRRIAPAPSPSAEDLSPFSRASTSHPGRSGIKRASTACQSCKHIKRKCDQQVPCSNCVKTGTECIYDQAQDGRRRAARKRNVEELELKRDALDTILDALRTFEDDRMVQLLNIIRSDASIRDIVQFVTDDHDTADEYSNSFGGNSDHSGTRLSVMSIRALTDNPPIRVSAAPWTKVTSDDDLVSHLVSIYFTWCHHVYQVVDEDIFLNAMATGDIESSFCSPLMVNSMLAVACQFSDHPGAFRNPVNQSHRGMHFLKEALRLWVEEAGIPNLANIQAGLPLVIALTLLGKDRLSSAYLDQLHGMTADLMFKVERGIISSEHNGSFQKSLSLASWSIYMFEVLVKSSRFTVNKLTRARDVSLVFMRPRGLTIPSIPRIDFQNDPGQAEHEWFPYPATEPRITCHLGAFTNLQYDLHEIGAEIGKVVFDLSIKWRGQCGKVRALDQQLRELAQRIPWPEEGTIINPYVLDLNLMYHWMRLNLFNFVKSPDSPMRNAMEDADLPQYAREQCLSSAKTVATLCGRYLHEFGQKNMTMWMPQPAILSAYILIEDLDENPDVHETFHICCLVLTSISRRWLLMRGHARMLFITAKQKGQVIEDRTKRLLAAIALDSWQSDDHKYFDGSAFPNYALAKNDDPRVAGMGDLLERWANFTLENRQVQSSSEKDSALRALKSSRKSDEIMHDGR